MEQLPFISLQAARETQPPATEDVALAPETLADVLELMGRALLAVAAAQNEETGDEQ